MHVCTRICVCMGRCILYTDIEYIHTCVHISIYIYIHREREREREREKETDLRNYQTQVFNNQGNESSKLDPN